MRRFVAEWKCSFLLLSMSTPSVPAPALDAEWAAHCVTGEGDAAETRAALARLPPHLHGDCRAALADALGGSGALYFVLVPARDTTEAEAATLRAVVEHCVGARWHRVIGDAGLVVRSSERSQAIPKSVFSLLCDVLEGRAPPARFGALARVPLTGVVWFAVESGGSDPGLLASWSAARDELADSYHDRCPPME